MHGAILRVENGEGDLAWAGAAGNLRPDPSSFIVKHLISNTSGMSDDFFGMRPAGRKASDALLAGQDEAWPLERIDERVRDRGRRDRLHRVERADTDATAGFVQVGRSACVNASRSSPAKACPIVVVGLLVSEVCEHPTVGAGPALARLGRLGGLEVAHTFRSNATRSPSPTAFSASADRMPARSTNALRSRVVTW